MFGLKSLSEGITILRSLVSTIKSVVDMLPKQEKEDASRKLGEAAEKLKVAEAQIAKELGYELCKCTWPPQIMLSIGKVDYGSKFKCPACGRIVSDDDMP